jgi:hypothetical protein
MTSQPNPTPEREERSGLMTDTVYCPCCGEQVYLLSEWTFESTSVEVSACSHAGSDVVSRRFRASAMVDYPVTVGVRHSDGLVTLVG